MPSPSAAASEAATSAFASAVLAAVGVPPQALLWGGIGAVGGVFLTGPETPRASALAVIAAALFGAAGGYAAAQWLVGRPVVEGATIVLCSLVIGAGAKPILSAAIGAAVALIGRLGGRGTGGREGGGEGGQ